MNKYLKARINILIVILIVDIVISLIYLFNTSIPETIIPKLVSYITYFIIIYAIFFIMLTGIAYFCYIVFASYFPNKTELNVKGEPWIRFFSVIIFVVFAFILGYNYYVQNIDSSIEFAEAPNIITIVISLLTIGLPFVYLNILQKGNKANIKETTRVSVMPFLRFDIVNPSSISTTPILHFKDFDKSIIDSYGSTYVLKYIIKNMSDNVVRDVNIIIKKDIYVDGVAIEESIINDLKHKSGQFVSMVKGDYILLDFEVQLPNKHENDLVMNRFDKGMKVSYNIHFEVEDILYNRYFQEYSIMVDLTKQDNVLIKNRSSVVSTDFILMKTDK